MYIRALTTDMNELEKQKQASDNKQVEETSKRLSDGFLALADLLQDNLYVSRECVLTSFSINPTWSCMERIEKLAISCGAQAAVDVDGQDSDESSKDKIDNNDKLIDNSITNSETLKKSVGTEVPPIDTGQVSVFSNSELIKVLVPQTLGLSEQLCDDLAVILSSPRYQLLSWVMPWPELQTACNSYLVNTERNVVKELKYLNIDYNQFKDWPEDKRCQYGGIEKGYEQYTEDENNSNTESDYMSYDQGYNDSDSSLNAGKRRKKGKLRKIYSSDSDFDIGHRGRLNRENSSDIDTASQDMDSLGSDGLQNTYTKSNISPNRNEQNMSPFSMLMNRRNQDRKLLGLFNRDIDKTSALISSFILPDKRASDPKTLKTLRMFRSNKKKSLSVNENQNQNAINENQNLIIKPDVNPKQIPAGKVINKLPLTSNMNPRVLLNRLDCNDVKEKCANKDTSAIKDLQKQKFPELDMDVRVILNRYDDAYGTLNNHRTYSNNKLQERARQNVKLSNVPTLSNISKDKSDININVQKTQQVNDPKYSGLDMNARVLLSRYDDVYSVYRNKNNRNYDNLHEKSRQLEVLADVPGLNTLEMIRPSIVQPTIQVVQVTTNLQNTQIRPAKSQNQTSTTTTSNIITSTPVTAHIQRVGNAAIAPERNITLVESESQENQSPSSSQNSTESKTSIVSLDSGHQSETSSPVTPAIKSQNSQATPTLVNILSQQIIRPGQANTTTNRNSTLINILSQQIIKPPLNQHPQKIFNVATSSVEGVVNITVSNAEAITTTAPSVVTSVGQLQLQNSNIKLVTTSQAQPVAFQHIINAQGKNNNQVIKNVNLVTNSANPVDATRLVQFLCKTDGKVVHLTPYPNANIKLQTIDSSKLIKTTTVISKPATMQSTSQTPISSPVRSSYEENFTKFIQTNTRAVPVKTVQGRFTFFFTVFSS